MLQALIWTARNLKFMSLPLALATLPKRQSTRRSDTQPEGPPTTLSGIAPGDALYDTPPPESQAPALERSQRSRKATARKLEWLESQAAAQQSKRQPPARRRRARVIDSPERSDDEDEDDEADDHDNGKDTRETRNAGPSQTPANAELPLSDTQMASVGIPNDNSVKFFSHAGVLYTLEQRIGQDLKHLSADELKALANSVSRTEAAAVEPTKWQTPTLVQPPTAMAVGGGYHRNRLEDHIVSEPPLQSPDVTQPSSQSRKRPASPSDPPPPKPALDDKDEDSKTESEPDFPNPLVLTPRPYVPPPPPPNPRQALVKRPRITHQSPIPTGDSKTVSDPSDSEYDGRAAGQLSLRATPRLTTRSNTIHATHPADSSASRPDSRDLSSLLRRDDMTSILQWALKVAEEHVRGQQVPSDGSNNDRSRSQIDHQQLPPAGNLASTSQSTSTRRHSTLPSIPNPVARKQTYDAKQLLPVNNDSDVADPEALRAAKVVAKGKPRPRKKAALGDYPEIFQQLAKPTVPLMMLKLVKTDPYASIDQVCIWIEEAFYQSWKAEAHGLPYEPPDHTYCKILARRPGGFRTQMVKNIRPIIESDFQFKKPVLTAEDAESNRNTSKTIVPFNFYCKDTKTGDEPYEHKALPRAIAAAYFPDVNGLGIKFSHEFDPVPLPAVALVLTMMQFCISEWESGRHEARDLDFEQQQPSYDAHMKGLERYNKRAGVRLGRFRGEWFKFGMECVADAGKKQQQYCQAILPTDRIRPDTPPL